MCSGRGIIIVLLLVFMGVRTDAQQVSLYSQYVLNNFLINPAIAGSNGLTTVNLTTRQQWIGFEEAPSTSALSAQTLLQKNSYRSKKKPIRRKFSYNTLGGKVGLGGYIFSDRNGASSRTGARFSYAYHLSNPQNKSQLSFGMSLTAYQIKFDEDRIILKDPDDDIWTNAREAVFIPDADFGMYYQAPDYFAGFSVDQLLESIMRFGEGNENYKLERNYYLMGGYNFKLNDDLILTPSTLLKFAENGAFQGDFGAKLIYDQTFWGGLTYRTGSAIIVLGGLKIDPFIFGYSFDISLSSIMKHSFGSHEFVLAVMFGEKTRHYRWLNK